MARKQGNLAAMRKRATRTVAASTSAAATPVTTAAPAVTKPKRSYDIGKLVTEVRAEARKITWTTWKETWITSVMVFLMVAITSVFFFLADWVLSFGVSQILKLATAT